MSPGPAVLVVWVDEDYWGMEHSQGNSGLKACNVIKRLSKHSTSTLSSNTLIILEIQILDLGKCNLKVILAPELVWLNG